MSGTLQVGGVTLGTHNSGTGKVDLTNQGTVTLNASTTFPAGHVIKTSSLYFDNSGTQSSITADATWTEIHLGFRLTHQAASTSNILLMSFSCAFNSPNASNIYHAKFYNQSGDTDITLPPAAGSRQRAHWHMRVTPSDANDISMLTMTMRHVPASTSSLIYTIYFYTQSPDVDFFASDLSDANGFSDGGTFIIQEIQA